MATTTPALILRVRDLVRDGPTRNRYRDEVYVRSAINPVLRHMEQEAMSRSATATFLTVAGQAAYTLPVGIVPFYYVERVSYGPDQRALTWRERYENVGPPTTGDPTHWTMWGGQIHLDPAPSVSGVTVQVDAYCTTSTATEVADSVDQLNLDADVEDVLVYGAAARMAMIDSEYLRARELEAMYRDRLRLLKTKLNPDRGDLASVVDGSGLDLFIEL